MPIIPIAPAAQKRRLPDIDVSTASSLASPFDVIDQTGKLLGTLERDYQRIRQAEDQATILKAQTEIDSEIRNTFEGFNLRTDYHAFEQDAAAYAQQMRDSFAQKYSANKDVWQALSPYIENKLADFVYSVGKRKLAVLKDTSVAAFSQKENDYIAEYIHAEDDRQKEAIIARRGLELRALQSGGMVTATEAQQLTERFMLNLEGAEITAMAQSGDVERMRKLLELIEDKDRFRTIKAKNPESLIRIATSVADNVRKAEQANNALGAAIEVWNRNVGGTYDLNQPIPIEKIYSDLRAHKAISGDPEAYRMAVAEVSRLIEARNKEQAEVNKASKDGCWKRYLAGESIQQIVQSPEFARLSGTEQAQFVQSVNSIIEAQNRAIITQHERQVSEVSRLLSLQRANEELNFLANIGLYAHLSHPDVLRNTPESELMAKIPLFGGNRVMQLLETKRRIESSPEKSAEIISNYERIKRAAIDMGIVPASGQWGDEQNLKFNIFRNAVEDAIWRYQKEVLGGKRAASDEEVKKIIDQIALDKVRLDISFGMDREAYAAMLGPEEMQKAYVEVNGERVYMRDIPQDKQISYAVMLRMLGFTPTSEAIATMWVTHGRKKVKK